MMEMMSLVMVLMSVVVIIVGEKTGSETVEKN